MGQPTEIIQNVIQSPAVQNTVGSCTSLWCITSGFLMDIKDTLSVISIIIGILVGVSIIVLNVKRMND